MESHDRDARRTRGTEVRPQLQVLPPESPLAIRAAGPDQRPVTLTTLRRTPGHDVELALGWLLTTGVIDPGEVVDTALDSDADSTSDEGGWDGRPVATVTVRLRRPVAADGAAVLSSATAGTDDRRSSPHEAGIAPLIDDPLRASPLPWSMVTGLPRQLRWAIGGGTGADVASGPHVAGLHIAGLFDPRGWPVTVRGDISRHNALDAAIGAHLAAGVWPPRGLEDLVCVLSGRVGYRLVRAGARARVAVLVAVGSASASAADLADRVGMTLVGSLRGDDGTVYTHPQRLNLDA